MSSTAEQLTRAARQARAALARRDSLIVQMHTEGASLREIGTAAGLSHGGVRRVLERTDRAPGWQVRALVKAAEAL